MNKHKRAELQRAIELIEEAKEIITNVADQEQEAFDNLTEGLQASEKGQLFEENASELQSITDDLDGQLTEINNIISK